MLPTSALDYLLPPELVATRAAAPRDAARLLVVRRSDPSALTHSVVRDLPAFLNAGDRLVFNATRVLPARLEGRKAPSGGRVQGLFVADRSLDSGKRGIGEDPGAPEWLCLLQSGHLHEGVVVELSGADGRATGVVLRLLVRDASEVGGWRVRVESADGSALGGTGGGGVSAPELLARVGHTPLPPYILKSRARAGEVVPDAADRERYQTVFSEEGEADESGKARGSRDAGLRGATAAGDGVLGSVAAPTAGLHFTPELLATLRARGVREDHVVLHVGSGTFRPVETDTVESHPIHQEWCSISAELAEGLASRQGGEGAGPRVVGVGTTAIRTMESYALWREAHAEAGKPTPWPAWIPTRLLITPGYRWRWTGAMLTNFHLPRSTLMAMTAAMLGDDPLEAAARLRSMYEIAVRERYRFYSYGDAMLILP